MPLFFPFIAILSVSHPTGSNSRSAKKWLFFALWKKWYYRCLSICLLLLFHIRGTSQVPEKKEIKSSVIVARCTPSRRNISCCQLPQYKEKGNECRTKSTTKFTRGGTQSKTIEELLCTPSFGGGLHQRFTFSQQCTFSSPSQHSLRILSSLLPFTRNLPSTDRPNSCTVLWQQLTCWLVLLPSLSMLLIGCP